MGSDLSQLRNKLEIQLNIGTTTTATDTSSTILNGFINNSIRLIARDVQPSILHNATPISANITQGQNSVTFPSDLIIIKNLYFKNKSNTFKELLPKEYKDLIQVSGTSNFFNQAYTGDPTCYSIAEGQIIFNKHFDRTENDVIKLLGVKNPTELVNDSDTTELSIDYNNLIIYTACFLFYQREDDLQNQQKFQILAKQEESNLDLNFTNNNQKVIGLDPSYFNNNRRSMSDPSVFFNS